MPRPQLSLRTPPQTADRESLASWSGAVVAQDTSFQLYASGSTTPLTKGERADLLKKVRAGEPLELELEAVTFIQRDTPNRNYVRFKAGIMPSFGASFSGQPFLKNHDTYDVASRGGTILASKLEHNDDGSKQIRMRLKLVKAWAVESALDGTLDRFSIGWNRTAPVQCSICEASFYKCDHWPGDKMDDGRVCEALFLGADGTEVSAVNVPAVVGTRIESISQLGIVDPGSLACILGEDATGSVPEQETTNMIKLAEIAVTLGLKADATEAEVLAAAQSAQSKLTIAEAAKKLAEDEKLRLEVEEKKRADVAHAKHVTDAIARLTAAGKIKPGDATEKALRSIGEAGPATVALFDAQVETLATAGAQVTPVGATTPAATPDPIPKSLTDGKAFIVAQPGLSSWLKRANVSAEDFEKHGTSARETIEFRRSQG